VTELAERVRRRLAATPLETAVLAEAGAVVDDTVFARLREEVAAELTGAGPLEALLAVDGVTDVVVNGPNSVWFDRGEGMERATVRFGSDAEVRRLAQRLATSAGRRLDDASPFVDAVLADGTRVHAVLAPLSEQTLLSLRVLRRRRFGLAELVAAATLPAEVAAALRDVVRARVSFLVTGGTGSGKTTLLGALLAEAQPRERLVLVEDAPELDVAHPHVVRLIARPSNVEGAGAIGQRELVRQALRMRPDRLVVGEFRGAEMAELLVALNTGHRGSGATLHANSAADVPARCVALGALAGLSPAAVTSLVGSALHVVVHLERGAAGRQVAELALLLVRDDRLVTRAVWSSSSGWSEHRAALAALLGAAP
jgi:pilus assembly protein CpaF